MVERPSRRSWRTRYRERKAADRKRRARWWRIWLAFRPFARRHRREFWKAVLGSFLFVGFHLAFPWPIKEMLKPWLKQAAHAARHHEQIAAVNPWLVGGLFMLVVLGLGLSDLFQRVHVARFAIAWVRDVRAEAFRAANRIDPRSLSVSTGDMVARLVGDTARLKAGMKGFMTHVMTNGILFIGVAIVLLNIDLVLGSIVVVAGILVFGITLFGAEFLYDHYLKLRKKEGKLATRIQEALSECQKDSKFAKVNYSSGEHEATVVRIQGRVTVSAQAVMGVAAVISLVVAFHGMKSGRLAPDGVLLFFMYLLDLHRPAVRLSRQGSRFGKMMACANRLERLIRAANKSAVASGSLPALSGALVFKKVRVGPKARPRLGPLDLRIQPGERLAVYGGPGAGKSTLLAVAGSMLALDSGKLNWDDVKLNKTPASALYGRVAFFPEQPAWLRQDLGQFLGLGGSAASLKGRDVLEMTGAAEVLRRLPQGLATKVSSGELSRREKRCLDLARVLLAPASLLLLDEPFRDLEDAQCLGILDYLEARGTACLITLGEVKYLERFQRLLVLEEGDPVYEGSPLDWDGVHRA